METQRLRSPLRFRALRLPGQSGDEAIEALFWDELALPILFATVLAIVAGFEWLMALKHLPPQPWLFTSLAVAASLYAARKGVRLRARFQRMRLWRDGERIVAEELDKLRAHGAHVFHDVPADRFNIDHVVFCDRGIYAIETKTWSKQSRDARIRLTDAGIIVGDHRPDRDPIAQVQTEVRWLAQRLKELTNKSLPVRGTVLIPGWFIEPSLAPIARASMGSPAEWIAVVHRARAPPHQRERPRTCELWVGSVCAQHNRADRLPLGNGSAVCRASSIAVVLISSLQCYVFTTGCETTLDCGRLRPAASTSHIHESGGIQWCSVNLRALRRRAL